MKYHDHSSMQFSTPIGVLFFLNDSVCETTMIVDSRCDEAGLACEATDFVDSAVLRQ